jgi:hypothetical protein
MSADALRAWGLDGDVPAIELAVSELVAHAVRKGDGPAEMRLGGGAEKSREPQQDLGLWFVDEVADDWGVDQHPGRTRVWLVRRRGANPGSSPVEEAGIG